MAPANNHRRTSIPSLAAVEHRRRELLAWQAAHRAPAAEPPEDPAADEDPLLEEVNRLAEHLESLQAFENFQQNEVPESPGQPYPAEYLIPSSTAPEPPALAEPALYGLAGLVVRSLAAHTEADPAALLLQFLAAFGNILGPALHCTVGATRHGLNLFVVLVGESSKARKGTSWRQIASLFTEVDPLWVARRVTTARPTPYAIINCQASARLFFNDAPIDPTVRRISEAISAAAPGGLSKDQIRGVFHGHLSKERIDLALQQLQTLGLIGCQPQPGRGRGRPATIWAPAGGAKDAHLGN
jgi:hypothetical protein